MTDYPPERGSYEQFERRQLAQDRDCIRPLQLAESDAQYVVNSLIDAGVVEPLPRAKQFVHRPTDRTFRSAICLAYFHRGWLAGFEGLSLFVNPLAGEGRLELPLGAF
ncbi:hypothetical protein [Haloarchaeobius sp. FL176]|uniref:hypothetical protein n=1 Tax=Haloarchaeobius TaxID=1269031 RepID=UPI00214912D4|nr:hypothetical protein [Haloarchaeobius sp. FL176]